MTEKEFRKKERSAAMKKAAQKAKKRKRRNAAIIALTVMLVLVAVLSVLVACVLFKIENIYVTGNSLYSNSDIISAAELEVGDALFLFNKNSVSNKVQKKLPFVSKIIIKRGLPSTLKFEITETKEEIYFVKDNLYYSANLEGKILKEYQSEPNLDLKILLGEENEYIVGNYITISDTVKKDIYNKLIPLSEEIKITKIDISNVFSINFIAEDRLVFNLGSSVDMDKKIAHMKAMFKKISNDDVGICDLSGWTEDKPEAFFTEKDISSYK